MQNSFCIFHCLTKTCPGVQPETYRMKPGLTNFSVFCMRPGHVDNNFVLTGSFVFDAGRRVFKGAENMSEIGQTYFKIQGTYFFFTPGGV